MSPLQLRRPRRTQLAALRWLVPCGLLALVVMPLGPSHAMCRSEKKRYSDEVKEIFDHAYGAYMTNAYPADELMPLSCKGRVRGVDESRGDIDDALGNFSLTLVDTLDALAVMGLTHEFLRAVQLVIADVKFDSDFVVSVFETNIRVLGGLLGAHTVLLSLREKDDLKRQHPYLTLYNNELLAMAVDLGDRLLLAFDTATGIPYSRVNLRHGLDHLSRQNTATCTACAGTMLLEFGALSRFTGDSKYEQAARGAMEALWSRRAAQTELVGETINITSGAWARTDSGIGAGIDSYYEYLLKSYILFGDETYYEIFKLQYDAVMSSLRQGPFIFHANMHRPNIVVRKHLDSLQMFWPGLQVLHGDLSSAKEMHRMHFELARRYDFSPEGYTLDFKVHWGNWPLRPEFIESTYFLYQATKDPFYLEVGKQMVDDLKQFAKVKCGYAAIQDVRKKSHEDKMDSFFLTETVKYLYLLFTEPEDLVLDMDDFVFTTEAHLLPLSLSRVNLSYMPFGPLSSKQPLSGVARRRQAVCAAPTKSWSRGAFLTLVRATPAFRQCARPLYATHAAAAVTGSVQAVLAEAIQRGPAVPYDPRRFIAPDQLNLNRDEDLEFLQSIGIFVEPVEEGHRLTHHSNLDGSKGKGLPYMKALIKAAGMPRETTSRIGTATIRFASPDSVHGDTLVGGQASFGLDLDEHHEVYGGMVAIAVPLDGCSPLTNAEAVARRVVIVKRGKCMFVDKVRIAQEAGADSVIVVDDRARDRNAKLFTMSGDGVDDIVIPAIFVSQEDGTTLMENVMHYDEKFTVELFSSKWDELD